MDRQKTKNGMLGAEVRTDLALEAGERLQNDNAVPEGLRVEKLPCEDGAAVITRVHVESGEAARRMRKPIGTYITIEASALAGEDEGYHGKISELLSRQIRELLPKGEQRELLAVGLGNRAVTADALGPKTIDHLAVNRHILPFYREETRKKTFTVLSAIEPGVMAKTGIETAQVVQSIVRSLKPDAVLVLDSLAARSIHRLYTTIQISNTGIAPGSGVGNHRNAIDCETLGVPVIAVGIPMVVDAATIVRDALGDSRRQPVEQTEKKAAAYLEKLQNMYVTTKEIDEMTERLSFTLSEAINALTKRE
ncbi:MAG: GPR endopeptidase [Lachnospiraceae bacterium]|nr:GPR endopeptidase [Lachnospiraceae bacterium]